MDSDDQVSLNIPPDKSGCIFKASYSRNASCTNVGSNGFRGQIHQTFDREVTSINSLFDLAIEFRNKGQLRDSVNVLSKILNEYPANKKTYGFHSVLGGVYSDLGENENALISFKKATQLDPKSELASLGLYVTLAKLKMDEEAIGELIRYLKVYPADLYKDTLEELLEGLKQGYITDYEDDIKNLARVNGFEI